MTTTYAVASQNGTAGNVTCSLVTWDAFVGAVRAALSVRYPCADLSDKAQRDAAKKGMQAFIPARLDPDKMQARVEAGKSARANECVVGSGIVSIDCDGVPEAEYQAALECARTSGHATLVYASPSDGVEPGLRRFRVCAPLDREIAPGDMWPARQALAAELGLSAYLDPSTKDPARLSFVGRLAGTPERECHVFGITPRAAGALASVTAPEPANEPHTTPVVEPTPDSPVNAALAPVIVSLIAPRLADPKRGGRHRTAMAIGGMLARAGWSDADIAAVAAQLPSAEPAGRVKDALDTAAAVRAGKPGYGAPTLLELGHSPGFVALAQEAATGGVGLAGAQAIRADAANDPTAPTGFGSPIIFADAWKAPPPRKWICEPLRLGPGAPTMLAAYGGQGKSWFLQACALSVSCGVTLFGTFAFSQGKAAHLDFEQGYHETWSRYHRLAVGANQPRSALANIEYYALPRMYLSRGPIVNPEAFDHLCRLCEGKVLVVIDSLRAATVGMNENDSSIREPLDLLQRVSDATGCTFIVAHHERKQTKDSGNTPTNQAMRGNSAINDGSQLVISLGQLKGGFTVKCSKIRVGKTFEKFGVEIADVPITGHEELSGNGVVLRLSDIVQRTKAEADEQLRADCQVVAELFESRGCSVTGGVGAVVALLSGRLSKERVTTATKIMISNERISEIPLGRGMRLRLNGVTSGEK